MRIFFSLKGNKISQRRSWWWTGRPVMCCDSWSRKELDMTEWLIWTELNRSTWGHTCSIKRTNEHSVIELVLISMGSFMIIKFQKIRIRNFQHLVPRDRISEEHTELYFFLPFTAGIHFCFICFKGCISFQIASTVTKNEFRA